MSPGPSPRAPGPRPVGWTHASLPSTRTWRRLTVWLHVLTSVADGARRPLAAPARTGRRRPGRLRLRGARRAPLDAVLLAPLATGSALTGIVRRRRDAVRRVPPLVGDGEVRDHPGPAVPGDLRAVWDARRRITARPGVRPAGRAAHHDPADGVGDRVPGLRRSRSRGADAVDARPRSGNRAAVDVRGGVRGRRRRSRGRVRARRADAGGRGGCAAGRPDRGPGAGGPAIRGRASGPERTRATRSLPVGDQWSIWSTSLAVSRGSAVSRCGPRRLLGVEPAHGPHTAGGERAWCR
ncbi:hypothetical protein HBB16_08115 [Pseudonocardia sp. MCCB 268]|nr:hypothetical protein [Pseudonocardia cytotoxica]